MKKVEGETNQWISVDDPNIYGGPYTLTRTKADGVFTFSVTSPDFKDKDFGSRVEAIKYIEICQKESAADHNNDGDEGEEDELDPSEDEE